MPQAAIPDRLTVTCNQPAGRSKRTAGAPGLESSKTYHYLRCICWCSPSTNQSTPNKTTTDTETDHVLAAEADVNAVLKTGTVITARTKPSDGFDPFRQNSYCKVAARATLEGNPLDVCLDTGCSTILVDRDWLRLNFPDAELARIESINLDSIGSKLERNEKAIFSNILFPGTVDGIEVFGKPQSPHL